MKYHIGDVQVIRGEPPDGNPYRGDSLMGPERAEVLRKFMRGLDTKDYTFWYAPCCGGAKRCTRDEVDWESSGISVGDWEDLSGKKSLMGGVNPDGFLRCRRCGQTSWGHRRLQCKCDQKGD